MVILQKCRTRPSNLQRFPETCVRASIAVSPKANALPTSRGKNTDIAAWSDLRGLRAVMPLGYVVVAAENYSFGKDPDSLSVAMTPVAADELPKIHCRYTF